MPEYHPDFWSEVEEAFAAALDADAAARPALLDARCGGRDDLRAEVDALLAAHARAGGFITPHTLPRGDLVPDESRPSLEAGSRVGPFRLIARIGQGGMGEIYRAERVEADFTQQVAIKLIAARFHGADAVRRFRAERQILAALQHPNIVALLDGGVTPDGQPYTAMEYVDGQPIADFCRARTLPLEARLRLFQQVCEAVSFAHRHLVVHRDLKPANVLVTGEGVVKVLDFGIAKLLEPGVAAASRTTMLMAPLTPDYASPEQVKGLPVTTACDVYALGVMLYELLTEQRPYDTAGRPLDEVVALVVNREPSRPSAAAGGGVAYDVRRLRGDLDVIVLKAMAKDPARRYASAADLADDVARFLAKRPVEARPPSRVYIARKTIVRHRAAFAIAAVCLVLLTAALVGAVWQARVAARERARAVQRLDDVRELAGALIFRIHDEIAPLAGSTPAREVVIAEGLKFLERLEADAAGDPEFLSELANAYIRIGDVQGRRGAANLGKVEEARRSYRKAVALAGAAGPSLDARRALANAHMALAGALERPESLAHATQAMAIAADWRAREPDSIPATESLARATFFVAMSTAYPEGLPHWHEADRLYHELLARDPGGPGRLRNAALTQKYLGGQFHAAGDWDRALEHYQRAYTLDERRIEATPDDLRAQLDFAIDQSNVASIFWKLDERQRAIEWYERSLDTRERLAAADPQDVYKRGRVAHVHGQLGRLYYETARLDLGRQHIGTAIDLLVPLAASDRGLFFDLGHAQLTAGDIARAAARHAPACAAYEAAVRSYAAADELPLSPSHQEFKAEAERQARACGARRP